MSFGQVTRDQIAPQKKFHWPEILSEALAPTGTQTTCSSSALRGLPMEDASMCDYSLSHLQSRPATVSDRLVVTRFNSSCTQGFTAAGDNANVVVCLQPGTELVFDKPVQVARMFFGTRSTGSSLARFRQVELDNPHTHHEALEFPDGSMVKVTRLIAGQVGTVLQLPRQETDKPQLADKSAEQKLLERASLGMRG